MLDTLRTKHPDFMYNHKIELIESEMSLSNDAGTNLKQKDRFSAFSLAIKNRESLSMFDGFGGMVSRKMDFDGLYKELSWICDAYKEKADFSEENEKIPVIILGMGGPHEFLFKFLTDLEGNEFGSGASLFSGKTGEKLFSDEFSLLINRDAKNTYNNFFDGEGTVLPDDKFALIENGVLKSPYTTKRIAKKYGYSLSGSASFGYDSTPSSTSEALAVARSDKTIKELLGGRKAIYSVMAAGGDFTPQGEYASPIQAAYLYDGENFLGRLPQLSMSSNVIYMFGKDFIGASNDGGTRGHPWSFLALDMNVRKIDGWL